MLGLGYIHSCSSGLTQTENHCQNEKYFEATIENEKVNADVNEIGNKMPTQVQIKIKRDKWKWKGKWDWLIMGHLHHLNTKNMNVWQLTLLRRFPNFSIWVVL